MYIVYWTICTVLVPSKVSYCTFVCTATVRTYSKRNKTTAPSDYSKLPYRSTVVKYGDWVSRVHAFMRWIKLGWCPQTSYIGTVELNYSKTEIKTGYILVWCWCASPRHRQPRMDTYSIIIIIPRVQYARLRICLYGSQSTLLSTGNFPAA